MVMWFKVKKFKEKEIPLRHTNLIDQLSFKTTFQPWTTMQKARGWTKDQTLRGGQMQSPEPRILIWKYKYDMEALVNKCYL